MAILILEGNTIMFTNKKIMRIKLETTKGTGVDPDTAVLAYDVDIMSDAEWIQRKGTGLYLGNQIPGILGNLTGTCSFKVSLRTAGTAAFDAAALIIFQCCGMSSTIAPVSTITDQKTMTLEVNEDGLLKQLTGCACELKLTCDGWGQPMYLDVTAHGMWATPAAEAIGSWSPSEVIPPKLGSGTFTFDSETPVIGKIEYDMGNVLGFRGDHFVVADRDVTMSFDPEDSTSYLFNTKWGALTEMAHTLTLVDSGGTITITCPKVQYKEIKSGDRDGLKTNDIVCQCNASSGNDELTLGVA